MKLKRGIIIPIAIMFMLLCYHLFYERPRSNEKGKKNYHVLHNAKINGRLSYIDHRPAFTYSFAIEGDSNYYYGLFVFLGDDRRDKSLQSFAQEGDSIIKEKNSDTIILIKNEKRYYYKIGGKPRN